MYLQIAGRTIEPRSPESLPFCPLHSWATKTGTTSIFAKWPSREAYPQVYNQKPGLGFPIARIGAITSLWCGAIVNLGFCRYAGKGQGEVSLVRRLWNVLLPGDVLLADSLISNWTNIFLLRNWCVRRSGRTSWRTTSFEP
jgi:hypothetical protein